MLNELEKQLVEALEDALGVLKSQTFVPLTPYRKALAAAKRKEQEK